MSTITQQEQPRQETNDATSIDTNIVTKQWAKDAMDCATTETEGASSSIAADVMRDSARVFASRDGGLSWELLASNNSQLNAELPIHLSTSARIGTLPNQQVQELFDNTGEWRQARVDIGEFAGESNIQLRFDFSTGGDFQRNLSNHNATATPAVIRSVTSDAVATGNPLEFTFETDSAAGIQVGRLSLCQCLDVRRLGIAQRGDLRTE